MLLRLFLTWLSKKFHNKQVDSVSKEEENTSMSLLIGGTDRFHNVLHSPLVFCHQALHC